MKLLAFFYISGAIGCLSVAADLPISWGMSIFVLAAASLLWS